MFAIVVSWLLVILMVALFVTGLHEKITVINWPLTVSYLFLPESSVIVKNCTFPQIIKKPQTLICDFFTVKTEITDLYQCPTQLYSGLVDIILGVIHNYQHFQVVKLLAFYF